MEGVEVKSNSCQKWNCQNQRGICFFSRRVADENKKFFAGFANPLLQSMQIKVEVKLFIETNEPKKEKN